MKLLPRAIPEGWEVLEGDGEGLQDPEDRATLRGNLNCVAGGNVNAEETKPVASPNTINPVCHRIAAGGEDCDWINPNGLPPFLEVTTGIILVTASSDKAVTAALTRMSPFGTDYTFCTEDFNFKKSTVAADRFTVSKTFNIPIGSKVQFQAKRAPKPQWIEYTICNVTPP